jgi:hypothetical protein
MHASFTVMARFYGKWNTGCDDCIGYVGMRTYKHSGVSFWACQNRSTWLYEHLGQYESFSIVMFPKLFWNYVIMHINVLLNNTEGAYSIIAGKFFSISHAWKILMGVIHLKNVSWTYPYNITCGNLFQSCTSGFYLFLLNACINANSSWAWFSSSG